MVWSLVAGTASVAVGIGAGSTALIGTGTDVMADMLSSVVLIWRFRAELHGGHPAHRVERRAHIAALLALLAVAAGVATASIAKLISGSGATVLLAGVITAAASALVLPMLGMIKLRVASSVPSPALRTDALITFVGAATAALALIGLLLTRSLEWWWADPAAALVIAGLAATAGSIELRTAIG